MTAGLMRKSVSAGLPRAHVVKPRSTAALLWATIRPAHRSLAIAREADSTVSELWFTSSIPCPLPEIGGDHGKPPDERTLKLGKSKST